MGFQSNGSKPTCTNPSCTPASWRASGAKSRTRAKLSPSQMTGFIDYLRFGIKCLSSFQTPFQDLRLPIALEKSEIVAEGIATTLVVLPLRHSP
jgi:hypothetical protein